MKQEVAACTKAKENQMEDFRSAPEVRKFLKANGFDKVKVRHSNSPFGGKSLYFVRLTDIPQGVTLVYSGGPNSDNTFGDHAPTVGRIAGLRRLLDQTGNARCDH